jgi:amidase
LAADPSPATAGLAYLDLRELRSKLDEGELTSRRLVETLLARIEDIDSVGSPIFLRSVLAVSPRALDEADASDRHRASGGSRPLEGIPILVKDNIEVLSLPSTAGSTALVGRPPSADAPLVRRLRHAGAVILGGTNLSEWANIRSARSTGGWSATGGLTANPWALDRNAGGSSSGSGAALAAGLAPLAIGTETDGSITCPASVNGVAGLKPTVGTVPTAGVVPISHSQDSPGPMARTTAAVAALYEVLAGVGSVVDRVSAGPAALRVAAARTWRTGHPDTDALFGETLERVKALGCAVTEVAPPVPGAAEHADELTVLLCELADGLAAYLPTRGPGGPQDLAGVVAHEDAFRERELRWFGHDLFLQALELGSRASEAYAAARRRNLTWALEAVLEPALAGADVLIAPAMGPAWKTDLVLGGHPAASSPVTMAPAIAGWPIATVPMGLVEGLPVGLAIVGRPGSEADLLALGAAIEAPARPTWTPPSRA